MTHATTVLFLALLVLSVFLYRYFGGQTRACFFCGTKTGVHRESCPWYRSD